ncbi:MAG: Baseplate J-like protein [Pelotomaculum sp. PtaB.Bin104]|nr:MAG: Baseplate J-like protein [Pelotomaculum sp. PtaB.Bin104]
MSAPKIDQRGIEDILLQIREMAPFYTPEWKPETADAGWALTRIFASMFEGIIKRLNQVPDKNSVEFLNMLGVKLLPAQQARAPVAFTLSSGATEPVLITAGTQVVADPADGGEPVIFETERNILATPAKLVNVFSVKPDSIFEASADLFSGQAAERVFELFDGADLQEHILYLGHSDLLKVENQVQIELMSTNWNPLLRDGKIVRWEYFGEQELVAGGRKVKQENWYLLDIDTGNSSSQKLVLKKKALGEIKETEINGIKNRWLRCVVNSLKINDLKEVTLENVTMAVKPLSVVEGSAEKAFYDNEDMAFYIEDSQLLDTDQRVKFELVFSGWQPNFPDHDHFCWQYYGKREGTAGWYELESEGGVTAKTVLHKNNTDRLVETEVKNNRNYWLRCLLTDADQASLYEVIELLDLKEFFEKYMSGFSPRLRHYLERYFREILFGELENARAYAYFPDPSDFKIPRELREKPGFIPHDELLIWDDGRIVVEYKELAWQFWKEAVNYLNKRSLTVEISVEKSPYILPDLMFKNDIPLELPGTSAPVFPFGRLPRVFDTFYLASSEALSKKDGKIILEFDISGGASSIPVGQVQGIGSDFARQLINHKTGDNTPDPIDTLDKLLKKSPEQLAGILTITTKESKEKPISVTQAINILEAARKEYFDKTGVYRPIGGGAASAQADELMLSWEYWDGAGWQVITGLVDHTGQLKVAGTVEFDCPGDLSATVVNGQENLWIRTRIISGDYGRERFISLDDKTWQTDTSLINPPILHSLKIQYATEPIYPEQAVILNNLEAAGVTTQIQNPSVPVKPFEPLADNHCALYLGFQSPPLKGPLSMFFSLLEQDYPEDSRPSFQWEYYREQKGTGEWVSLEVLDGTSSLSESGCLEFIGPPDMADNRVFGRDLYWIRAVDGGDIFKGANPSHAPILTGIYLNTTWATQSETVSDEILGSSNGEARQSYTCGKFPIISEDIWVNELIAISEYEKRTLAGSASQKVKEVTDEKGNTTEFWIKWDPVDDFLESGPDDRHYLIDRAFGVIRFGDGINGAVPPVGADNVRAGYRAGGGARGNVGQGEITGLKTSIAFVDGVNNPEPADGGSDTETLEKALERGPQMLRHQNRAVTLEDFEWLAREASRNIARVKCLPNIDDQGEQQSGWVTVVIVPESKAAKPKPSLRLKKQVEKRLQEQTANVIAFPRHLRVIGPDYQEISVSATVIAITIDIVPVVENRALQALNAVLHPLTGGSEGRGWEFGRFPQPSDLYALLEGIEGVDHVEALSITIRNELGLEINLDPDSPLDPTSINYAPNALVYSGKHTIRVKANMGGIA